MRLLKSTKRIREERLQLEAERDLIHEWSRLAIIGGGILIGLVFVLKLL